MKLSRPEYFGSGEALAKEGTSAILSSLTHDALADMLT